jgi:phage protein D
LGLIYSVNIAGQEISATLEPILIDLSVSLRAGTTSDQASITVDDSKGRIRMPKDGDPGVVSIRGVEVFRGTVNDVSSKGDRGGGRTLAIGLNGMDTKGKAKEQKLKHWDQAPVKKILEDAGKAAGVNDVRVDPEIGSQTIEYLLQHQESFIHLGQRLSVMLGGTFKIMGDRAIFVKRGAATSASGQPLVPVIARWGEGGNLLGWDITPIIGRARHKTAKVRHYDKKKAEWQQETSDSDDQGAVAAHTARYGAANKDEAKSRAKSDSASADRERGGGSIEILGNERAQPEAKVTIVGARPGIDGTYTIDGVIHKVSRGGGFDTSLQLKQPGGGAGTDTR